MMTVRLEAQIAEPTAPYAIPFTAPAPVDAMPRGADAREPVAQPLRDRVRSVYPK